MTIPSRFQKEVHAHLSQNQQQSNAPSILNENTTPSKPRLPHSAPYSPKLVQSRLKEVLNKHSNGLWVSKLPQLYREHYKQDLPSEALKDLEHWTHICTVEKPCSTKPQELLLYPAKETSQITPHSAATPPTHDKSPFHHKKPQTQRSSATSKSSTPASPRDLPPDVKQKLGELLLKYSSGLWAHALPKLYQDTYKCKLPEFVLDHLTLLSDICTIDYPMPDNPKRAILYTKVVEDENRNQSGLAGSETKEAVERSLSSQTVPSLVIPREEYPSVLVVEAGDTNSVILRYIGEGYSKAQEKLEDEMREFYGQDSNKVALTSPLTGQLTAVCAEEEEEILRAQVCEVMADKVKVYYVDHGFSEIISKSKLFELHEKFYRLPFQATKCKLAGLESFSQEQAVLKRFESMATGKILLAEILERQEVPLVVLYDTSQDDDININAACMKALQDKSLESPLKVNSAYMNVNVTSVCSDGTIYCQVPSRGLTKLNEFLEKTENYLHSQVTSELLVSRPFCGKICLARYKGKWSRVEITNLHGSRVVDILFVDVGVQASIEVTELREIPPPMLRDLISTPAQALKCCLADLPVSVGSWTPDAVQWLRDTALHCSDCSLKIAKVDEPKRLAHVYLFTSKNFHDTSCSLNQQLANCNLWNHQKDVFLSSRGPSKSLNAPTSPATIQTSTDGQNKAPHTPKRMSSPLGSQSAPPGSPPEQLALPPLLELPEIGQNLDVFVSVACHPGHFVLQPWHDMYKLVDLMGEMILHYNKMEEKPLKVEKNQVCAAKVENNWYRVLVKGVLTNGLVSVFQLDYGKHELVSCTQLRPLTQEFCQLPFQAITAQLAGVKPRQWSEEASIVFRNHVEKKPLVAQLESVQEASQPWDRKVVIYLVDTSQEERDIWLHDIMAEFTDEMSNAA
ncbi:tudor domain-containing protein 7B isoform X2 [Puntigrus tetrazona]|nr:tudor domain-containing protein 7B isoform X2 [Puntigrus tetrazona]XP_043100106.1 tudor domain-containing protein 7B isoform X2 [Puntigrus tetrazona]XP_043100107.1 tudor domain-containing protein 7B isoform X2 [Puntigrus tetrazona]XP_043100108.1 tudor domain-containing protein 7B isoform X2 [Puntigrus tetrazona]XP_043100109.1 tudor domain-containing protein 7B isoform X2 [Puntigrus tetrazona]